MLLTIKTKWSHDCPIFIMGIIFPEKLVFIEVGPNELSWCTFSVGLKFFVIKPFIIKDSTQFLMSSILKCIVTEFAFSKTCNLTIYLDRLSYTLIPNDKIACILKTKWMFLNQLPPLTIFKMTFYSTHLSNTFIFRKLVAFHIPEIGDLSYSWN